MADLGIDDPTGGATFENFPSEFSTGLMGGGGSGFNELAIQALGGVGRSLMTSPSNNMLRDFGSGFQQAGAVANGNKAAVIQALKAKGFSDIDAMRYADNPQLAAFMLGNSPSGAGGASPPALSGGLSDGLGSLFKPFTGT